MNNLLFRNSLLTRTSSYKYFTRTKSSFSKGKNKRFKISFLTKNKNTDNSLLNSKKNQGHILRRSSMYSFIPITQPTNDTSQPLLLLQSDRGDKYFFGKVTEGCQRSVTEKKLKLSKLKNIFLTGKLDWANVGGLPGMVLTIADQGKEQLSITYSNNILDYLIATWRYFIFRFGIHLNTSILKDNDVFEDDLLKVKSIEIRDPTSLATTDIFSKDETNTLKKMVSHMFPKSISLKQATALFDSMLNISLPKDFYTPQISACYEIQFKNVRGKFKAQEAIKLGVPKGPLFAKLANGEPVTLENGSIVIPEQVLEQEREFPTFLIIDIPNNDYIAPLIEKFSNYDISKLGAVYYFLDKDVVICSELIRLMESFGSGVESFVSHPNISQNSLSFIGSSITTLKLKAFQPNSFNLPNNNQICSYEFFNCFKKDIPSGVSLVKQQEDDLTTNLSSDKAHIYDTTTTLVLHPSTDAIKEKNIQLEHTDKDSKSLKSIYDTNIRPLSIPGLSYEKLITNELNINHFNNKEKEKSVEVITLGTGSALPSKYRNVASTLFKVPYVHSDDSVETRCVLFDAGENTIGSLKRIFLSRDYIRLMKNLRVLYLSHLHADHHLGFISLLKEWHIVNSENTDAKLFIIAPWQYERFLEEWSPLESIDILAKVRFINSEHFINDSYVRKALKQLKMEHFNSSQGTHGMVKVNNASSHRDLDAINDLYKSLNIKLVQTCKAIHCPWAYSGSLTFYLSADSKQCFKVSYSGDTRPNIKNFAKKIGYRSDLLIHEATLDNDLQEDAVEKFHCTINEAIEVSNEMKAKKLIMTHFSQRYPKIPQLSDCIDIEASEHCFAFDNMIIDYDNLGSQTKYLSDLDKILMTEVEE